MGETDDDPVWAVGLMSGTSLDGVDAALLRTDGVTVEAFGPGAERPYRPGDADAIAAVMNAPSDYRPPSNDARARQLSEAAADVDRLHAEATASLIAGSGLSPELVGYHGQTVAHDPEAGWTWQLGDGEALARAVNRPVVWDFRNADMEAGGEGAPLAPFYHWALARHIGLAAPVAFLNIGGVANVTWVDPRAPSPETPGALLAFDTGPGNALLNDWMMRRVGAPLDRGGAAAVAGTVARGALSLSNEAMSRAVAYLDRPAPKSLDRNDFSGFVDAIGGLSTEDGAATLTATTVDMIALSGPKLPSPPARWLVCGGGRKNPVMMLGLAERLGVPVEPVEAVGLDGDMLEAQAFAYLAVRVARGLPTSAPSTTGCAAPVVGGRIARP